MSIVYLLVCPKFQINQRTLLNGGIVYRKFKSKKTISNYKPPKKELGVYEKYEINQMKEFNRAKESGQL